MEIKNRIQVVPFRPHFAEFRQHLNRPYDLL
jgi:hypothetical protein